MIDVHAKIERQLEKLSRPWESNWNGGQTQITLDAVASLLQLECLDPQAKKAQSLDKVFQAIKVKMGGTDEVLANILRDAEIAAQKLMEACSIYEYGLEEYFQNELIEWESDEDSDDLDEQIEKFKNKELGKLNEFRRKITRAIKRLLK